MFCSVRCASVFVIKGSCFFFQQTWWIFLDLSGERPWKSWWFYQNTLVSLGSNWWRWWCGGFCGVCLTIARKRKYWEHHHSNISSQTRNYFTYQLPQPEAGASQLQPIQVGYSIPIFCCISYIIVRYFVPIKGIAHSARTYGFRRSFAWILLCLGKHPTRGSHPHNSLGHFSSNKLASFRQPYNYQFPSWCRADQLYIFCHHSSVVSMVLAPIPSLYGAINS
jgi:hypothetical protein